MSSKYERDDAKDEELVAESRERIGQMRSLLDELDRVAEALQDILRQRKGGDS